MKNQNTIPYLLGILLIGIGIGCIIASDSYKKDFKPLYQVDPKQDSYIILNGEVYDTVPHGKLEEYIQNDNL